MASLRKSRNLANDPAIAKFLYIILKQLDLKSIDWQEVANEIGITNGHAARMRYSRLKAQMEGQPAASRTSKAAVPRKRKAKADKGTNKAETSHEVQQQQGEASIERSHGVKAESQDSTEPMRAIGSSPETEPVVKKEPMIKVEPGIEAAESGWRTRSNEFRRTKGD
ncbi:hypothetical protein ACLMJK_002189 [Lecanora helva]